jgi:energy-converting hydrogenase Eha subunit A
MRRYGTVFLLLLALLGVLGTWWVARDRVTPTILALMLGAFLQRPVRHAYAAATPRQRVVVLLGLTTLGAVAVGQAAVHQASLGSRTMAMFLWGSTAAVIISGLTAAWDVGYRAARAPAP